MWKSKGIRWLVAGLVILTMLMGGGCGLFNKAPEIASLTPSATVVGPGGSCTLTCTASDPDEDDTITYAWSATAGAITGTGSTAIWTAPATEGTYIISVIVSDDKGGTATESCDIEVANTPPVITSLAPGATAVGPGGSCTVTCTASDPDGDTITYTWSATGGAISGTGSTVTWTAPATEGTYTITVSVSDDKGGTATGSCNIEVANTPPVITSLAPGATTVLPNGSCTVTCIASDADGDPLTYAWSATGGTFSGTGNSVTWKAPAAEATYTISVTVSDGKGGTATGSCAIVVEMRFGSINIQSSPSGATVYLDGMDTGNITPYVITNLPVGLHLITLDLYHYEYRSALVTVNADETTYINWPLTYASEQMITIQPDPSAGKDSSVNEYNPNTNWGTDTRLAAGSGTADTCRAYIQFSLASLPDDAVILSARLGLCYHYTSGSATAPIGAYRVLGAWNESTITWINQPTPATASEYNVTVPSGVTDGFLYWYITNLVEGWWAGTIPNYGVVMKDTDESTIEVWKAFYSSDWSTASQRPKLIIYYYDPTP
jgi:hypothetical protein